VVEAISLARSPGDGNPGRFTIALSVINIFGDGTTNLAQIYIS